MRAALDGLRHAFDPQGFEPTRDERSFALAMADATATVLMPALIGALVGRHARSDLRVLPLASRDPRPQLEHGSADLALGFFPERRRTSSPPKARARRSTLEPLYACEYVCVMRRGHAARAPSRCCRSTTTAPPSTSASASPAGRAASSTRRSPRSAASAASS